MASWTVQSLRLWQDEGILLLMDASDDGWDTLDGAFGWDTWRRADRSIARAADAALHRMVDQPMWRCYWVAMRSLTFGDNNHVARA